MIESPRRYCPSRYVPGKVVCSAVMQQHRCEDGCEAVVCDRVTKTVLPFQVSLGSHRCLSGTHATMMLVVPV